MMRYGVFYLIEGLIFILLAVVVFVVILWQPLWVWITAGIVMLAGFVGIIAWAKSKPSRALLLAFLCPLSYTFWLLGLGVSNQSGSAGLFASAAVYYVGGALLLWLHQVLNAKCCRSSDPRHIAG